MVDTPDRAVNRRAACQEFYHEVDVANGCGIAECGGAAEGLSCQHCVRALELQVENALMGGVRRWEQLDLQKTRGVEELVSSREHL